MSDFSTNLQLPYLMPAQAQKHVTVNEALRRMDALVQMRAQSRGITAQPASPGDGDLWILPAGKTGADWDGFTEGRIAYYRDGAWEEIAPRVGWFAFVVDEDQLLAFTADGWTSAVVAGGALLESECASPASLKAIDQNLAAASTPAFARLGVGSAPDAGGGIARFESSHASATVTRQIAGHASYTGNIEERYAVRSASADFSFARWYSAAGGDAEFSFEGNGNGKCDGAWSGGGADYAEYFEWADGNPDADDRRGLCVVLAADGLVRPATDADPASDIIGAVSAHPTVTGDAAWNKWDGKYLRDEFGAYLREEHGPPADGAEDAGGACPPLQRRVLNPAYDPAQAYTPRSARPEWAPVGLMGKLRIRAGQPVGDRWRKMRDISAGVEEWLVR